MKSRIVQNGATTSASQVGDKVTELKKHAEATISKVDAKAGTITVKMLDKDGKRVEKTFRLVEDRNTSTARAAMAVLDIFQSGDDILFVEADGRIKGLKKSNKETKTGSKDTKDTQEKKKAGE